jgi:Type IV secretion system pilin
MVNKKITVNVAVFTLIAVIPLFSMFFGSHKVLAQNPAGWYYYSNDTSCAPADQNSSLCYYWDGTQMTSGPGTPINNPSASGGQTTVNNPASSPSGVSIPNPLKGSNTLYGFISDVIQNVLIPIGGILAVLYIMYSGFLMVTARGNEDQIKKGRLAFTHAAIGTAILLGAWIIATVIQNTISSLTG